ncbi:MAG: CRISPR-associated helicase Cas3' [Lentisphaerae bacterium]|nr:CRISPR-associated helicase Cas3' [Lentisphaerota bacterium]
MADPVRLLQPTALLERIDWSEAVFPLFEAVAGHHGQPCRIEDAAGQPFNVDAVFSEDNRAAIAEFVRELEVLFLGDGPMLAWSDDLEDRFKELSWLLAGLVVLADWIGSNTVWFPPVPEALGLREYWEHVAKPRAAKAVADCLVIPPAAGTKAGMSGLFPGVTVPSPLQEAVEQIELNEGPHLFIIEEATGGGKTEAALVLAQRLMHKGLAEGIYFGLPTMATANAMLERLVDSGVYKSLYAPDGTPSVILAHSARNLSETFLRVARRECNEDGGDTDLWLADNRKKSLLAAVGVGTIDQALLAVLPSRHQCLRLLGLARNVLIVDEAHACDAYMHRLLCTLVEFHAALGGSAIVLSATLDAAKRQELAAAFSRGAKISCPTIESGAYPLLTALSGAGVMEIPLAPRTETVRTVNVHLLHSTDAAIVLLMEAAASGRCACWIRNTVQDAVEAFLAIRERTPLAAVSLFHARFAMGDRLEAEHEVKRLFGKTSSAAERRGRILIATQVVEQSLDLDFDVLVTDLAPIDRIIQRAGRLHRHTRDAHGNPKAAGGDERGPACLSVLAPDPADSPHKDWYKNSLPHAAWVYPSHGQLWLTARLLRDAAAIRTPGDVRPFVDGVFGKSALARIPASLQRAESRQQGENMARSNVAAINTLKRESGYTRTLNQWVDDTAARTRLDDETITVRLARWRGVEVVPWSDSETNAWFLSDVNVRRSLIAKPVESAAVEHAPVETAIEGMPDKGRWCVLILMRECSPGVWTGRARNVRDEELVVQYEKLTGITVSAMKEPGGGTHVL